MNNYERQVAVHEAGHAVACVAQGIKVNVIWVKGISIAADTNICTFPVDDGFDFDLCDGLCDNDCDENPDAWKRLVVDVAGVAAEQIERLHQDLPATLDEFVESADYEFAQASARRVIADRRDEATFERIAGSDTRSVSRRLYSAAESSKVRRTSAHCSASSWASHW